MSSSKIYFMLLLVMASIGWSCANSTPAVKETTQVQKPGNLPIFYMFKGKDSNIANNQGIDVKGTLSTNGEAEWLVGSWKYNWQLNGMSCQDQIQFLSNGGYRSSSYCSGNPVAMKYAGNWQVIDKGTIQVGYTEWSPKYDQNGEPFTVNPYETFYFQALDQNRMQIHGNTIAYRQ